MNEKENEDLIKRHEQLEKIQDALGSYFEKEDMEVGMVMSVLLTMLIIPCWVMPMCHRTRLSDSLVKQYVTMQSKPKKMKLM